MVKQFYFTYRWDINRYYLFEPKWQWRSTSYYLILQNWSLTIWWFRVLNRRLVRGFLTDCAMVWIMQFSDIFMFFTFMFLFQPTHLSSGYSVRSWPRRPGFNLRSSHNKDLKMILDNSLLNTQHNKVRIKSKVEQSRERCGSLPYTSV